MPPPSSRSGMMTEWIMREEKTGCEANRIQAVHAQKVRETGVL
ncbi:MAG: hypothetical protein VB020_03000 [Methanocorpusculum sp.]|nr:hypothetical protein [Methanocorpusculum sp.]